MRVTATLLLWGMCCLGAQASSITYITPTGSHFGTDQVSALATFTTDTGKIMVTLENLEANPRDVVQNLSDLFFTVSNGSTVTGATFASGSAGAIRINGSHMITNPMTLTTTDEIGWVLSSTSTQVHLDVLTGPHHAGPSHTIIGPPATSGLYSNANGSIANNGPHNPFIEVTATWVIDAPVTSSTTITATTFSFGTTAGNNIDGIVATVVPEPSSMMLLGSGLLVLTQVLRRKLLKSRKA